MTKLNMYLSVESSSLSGLSLNAIATDGVAYHHAQILSELSKAHPIVQIGFTNPNHAYVVEASAGTGKTWTIERLFVKALLERNQLSLEKILVVTFTNDAVNELKVRILEYITSIIEQLVAIKNGAIDVINDIFIKQVILSRNVPLEKDLSILNSAMQNFDCASIYTIHGFCNKVLTNYQFDCNISYPFQLITTKKEILKDLVYNFFREKIVNNKIFRDSIEIVYQNLEQILSIDRNSGDFINKIVKLFSDNKILKYHNGDFKLAYQVLGSPHLDVLATDLSLFKADDLAQLENNMLNHLYSGLAKYIEHNFMKFYQKSNQLDFDDLIEILADSVVSNRRLADNIFMDYPIVFIDEFQDTDMMQWQIFSEIYQLSTKNRLADKQSMRGNVVVVGDPKQSIYRFRGADINVYLDAKQIINNTLSLNENRRSHPNIINFINQLFDPENNSECFGAGINYMAVEAKVSKDKLIDLPGKEQLSEILAKHNITDYNPSISEVQIVAVSGTKVEDKEQQLMLALVSEILLLLNANPNLATSMAVLVPQNKHAVLVVKTLANYGIPAQLSKRENIFATRTAEDLFKVLEATLDLSNLGLLKKALATYLFNIPYDKLDYFIDGTVSINISQCFYAYKEALAKSGIITMIYLLINDLKIIHMDILSKLGIDSLACVSDELCDKPESSNPKSIIGTINRRDVANLIQLSELIHKNCSHMKTQEELLYWFRNKIQEVLDGENSSEDIDGKSEELVRLDNDEKQIQVLTQHTSKGLEFDILFCPYFKDNIYNISTLTHLNGFGKLKKTELKFIRYRDASNLPHNLLSDDGNDLQLANLDANYEANRLNYVTLTRAKSRLYIYLMEIRKSNKGDKYYGVSKPSIIDELFGFNFLDINDNSHKLFNYPKLFIEPHNVIKNPELLSGVQVYSRKFTDESMADKLKFEHGLCNDKHSSLESREPRKYTISNSNFNVSYSRQSYTSLIKYSKLDAHGMHTSFLNSDCVGQSRIPLSMNKSASFSADNSNSLSMIETIVADSINSENKLIPIKSISYTHSILNELKGAKFGLLIHSLCESYPLTRNVAENLLTNANISTNYCDEVVQITDRIFSYPLLGDSASLGRIHNRVNELAFNLSIKKNVSIKNEIRDIIKHYYGETHPFTIECGKLDVVKNGFLSGFIDVFFEYDSKYYVLDYKTNSLDDYTNCYDINDTQNPLLLTTASSHYYLQYLLYLVAIKRYLQLKLNLDDVMNYIGGAVYFYIRGIFVNDGNQGGIFIDNKCQDVVSKLDKLFDHVCDAL